MPPLPTTATNEEKLTLLRTDAVRCTTEDHKLVKKMWIHASGLTIINTNEEETGKYRMIRGHWVTDRSDLWYNFDLETAKAVVTRYPISSSLRRTCGVFRPLINKLCLLTTDLVFSVTGADGICLTLKMTFIAPTRQDKVICLPLPIKFKLQSERIMSNVFCPNWTLWLFFLRKIWVWSICHVPVHTVSSNPPTPFLL